MLYLTQALFLPWLLAAMLWGAVVGWRASSRMPRSPGLSWFAIWLGIFTFGMLLAGALALPGRWGLWLDTALHFLFWYIVGCALGSLMSYVGAQEGAPEPVAAWARPIRMEGGVAEPQPWSMPGWIRPPAIAATGPVPALEAARAWLDVLRQGGNEPAPGVPAWMKPIGPANDPNPAPWASDEGRWPAARIQEPVMAAWVQPTPQTSGTPSAAGLAAQAASEDPGRRWPSNRDADDVPGWARPVTDMVPATAAVAPAAAAPASAKAKPKAVKAGQWQASKGADGVVTSGSTPADLGAMATAALGHLEKLDRGIASVVDSRYTLTGSAAAGQREAVLAAVQSLPKGFSLAHVEIALSPAAGNGADPDAVHDGERPPGLAAPRAAKADDLKRIRGIGRQNEARLNGLGIFHFDQVAGWSPQHALWVGSYLAFPGRIEREDWVGQAKLLASGGDTEFSKRVDKGLVATSKG